MIDLIELGKILSTLHPDASSTIDTTSLQITQVDDHYVLIYYSDINREHVVRNLCKLHDGTGHLEIPYCFSDHEEAYREFVRRTTC